MSEKIRDYLGIAIIVAALAFGYAAVSYVQTYSRSSEPTSYRSFSVTGDGKAVAIPDVAAFSFSVITEGGKSLADLQKQNTEKANKAIAFIKSSGVDAKDIQTQNYSVNPRYQSFNCGPRPLGMPYPEIAPCPPSEIVGYTVTQSVGVKIRNFAKAGDIVSGVVEQGANSVTQLSFTIDDPSKPQSEAREKAIVKAKEKAKAVAKAGGFRIGRLLSIDEGGYPGPYYDAYGKGGGFVSAAVESAPAPTIEPGSQDVTVSVTLRYEIQ